VIVFYDGRCDGDHGDADRPMAMLVMLSAVMLVLIVAMLMMVKVMIWAIVF